MKQGKPPRQMRRWKENLCIAACVLGFLLILGTFGAADLGQISLCQMIAQSVLGLALFVGGGILGGIID